MATRSDGLTLEMDRVLPAVPSVVFEFFTDRRELARWWGPEGFSTPSVDFDPRVGESYRIEIQLPEGNAFYLTGEFRAVDLPTRLAYKTEARSAVAGLVQSTEPPKLTSLRSASR